MSDTPSVSHSIAVKGLLQEQQQQLKLAKVEQE